MKLYHFMWVSVLFFLVLFAPLCTDAGEFVTGPEALNRFEYYQRKYLDTYVDFENFKPDLYLKLGELPLKLWTDEIRWPPPNRAAPSNTPVAILPYDFVTSPANHRLMGVSEAKIPDGQSSYIIYFDKCQKRVGLLRQWLKDFSITRFFSETKLLKEHINRANQEFIGYLGDGGDDCVKFVEIDGYPSDPTNVSNKLYQVGEVDNLFFSTPSIKPIIELNGSSDPRDVPVVIPEEKFTMIIKTQNIASYTIRTINIILYLYDPEEQEIARWTLAVDRDIPPGETVITNTSGSFKAKAKLGVWRYEVKIFHEDLFISSYSKSIRLADSKASALNPIFQLLLKLKDSD